VGECEERRKKKREGGRRELRKEIEVTASEVVSE